MSQGPEYSKVDHSSLSNVTAARTTHLSLNWEVDFDSKTIRGSAKHAVEVLQQTAQFVLDSKDLTITRATVQGKDASFSVAEAHEKFGNAVTIDLGSAGVEGASLEVEIFYQTHPEASATQWLEPALTAGKEHPYLFTQCQAIHARSLLPCQDAPGNKITYDATVTVPGWATALMSAVLKEEKIAQDKHIFTYEQQVPIPSYLIALAVGQLDSRDISERVKVWAEPSMVKAVAYEFGQTEEFLQIAESLTSPYMWGRYDVLCLPPSFPYGGMENPCLTFVTPTLLAGDRSLADVVAHEIAHSWTGNLITNHTWEHFWLNEGWTVWLERKIMAAIQKDDRYRDFVATIGWKHLQDDINHFGAHNPLTSLIPPLEGVDPDDSFSSVPYEKGFNFLLYLERLVGSAKFDNFAHAYIDRFKYSTITSGEFRDFFIEYFQNDAEASAIIDREVDWKKWFFTPGMPVHTPQFDQTFGNAAIALADKWLTVLDGREALPAGVSEQDLQGWTTQQTLIFLERLISECESRNTKFPETALASMDKLYHLTENRNSEISLRWQQLCLSSECAWIVPHVVRFVTSQGRMKFVRPLYRALFNSTVGKAQAVAAFSQHHGFYHPIARKMVAHDLGVKLDELAKQSTTRNVGAVHVPSSNTPPAAPSKNITATPCSSCDTASWLVPTLVVVAAVAGAAFYFVRNRK